jgi:hypothetical protein
MNDFKHLHTVNFDLFELWVICRMSSFGDRDLSPFFIGGYRNALILKSLELLVSSLGLEATFSLDKGRFLESAGLRHIGMNTYPNTAAS